MVPSLRILGSTGFAGLRRFLRLGAGFLTGAGATVSDSSESSVATATGASSQDSGAAFSSGAFTTGFLPSFV